MKPPSTIKHEFVEYIPDELEDGTLYVSIPFTTAVHKCFCGCGHEVVTPLSPTDWELTFDGKTVSLHPSIGSWSLDCQSHYWIRHDRVEWAARWSRKQIEAGRARDRLATQTYFEDARAPAGDERNAEVAEAPKSEEGFWKKLRKWWSKGAGKA
jgi:hypothetical protein